MKEEGCNWPGRKSRRRLRCRPGGGPDYQGAGGEAQPDPPPTDGFGAFEEHSLPVVPSRPFSTTMTGYLCSNLALDHSLTTL